MTSLEPRQRWRLALGRPAGETQRDTEAAWAEAIVRSGLPIATTTGERGLPRLLFAAPLPIAVSGERELADLLLVERRRRVEVRSALEAVVPPGQVLRDLYDVWLGEPGLPSLVSSAEYRIRLGPGGPATPLLAEAIRRLLQADHLEVERGEGDRTRRRDLRPLVGSVALVDADPTGATARPGTGSHGAVLLLQLRHDPVLGAGRADEVVAALGALAGIPLDVAGIVRERLLVRGEPG